LCADLWQEIWADPGTQRHGRSGQQQHGVDIYGCPNQGPDYEGVQCKCKDGRYGQEITEVELKTEVEKAKKFHPPLKRFILATTAPSDQKIQLVARKFTEEHLSAGLFSVEVLGWDEIQRRLASHPKVIDKHYAFGSSRQKMSEGVSLLQESQRSHESIEARRHSEILEAIQKFAPYQNLAAQPELGSTDPIDEFLNENIDQCREWINRNKPQQALDELSRIQEKYWDRATDRTKFRILTNVAAANLNLGDINKATKGFFAAVEFDPNDEKGLCNIALAYLLNGQDDEAFAAAQTAIELFPESVRGFSLLVAASTSNAGVSDPTVLVPKTLWATTEIAYAFGRFYAKREDNKASLEWMEKAYGLDDKDLETRAGYAEAILCDVLKDEAVSKGRCLSQAQRESIKLARNLLSDVWDEVKSTDVAGRFLVHVHNLLSAKGLLGEIDNAIAISNEAIKIDPNYGMIKRQAALFHMEKGEFKEAVSILETLPDDSFPEKALMHAEALSGSGEPEKALEKVDWFLEENADSEYISSALRLRVNLQQILKGTELAISETEKLRDKHPDDVFLLVQLSELKSGNHNFEGAIACIQKAYSKLNEKSIYAEKWIVAEALFKHGFYSDAAVLYEDLAGDGGDIFPLRQLFRCFLESDQRRAALSKLSGLSKDISTKPFYLMVAGIIKRRAGNIEEAKKDFAEYLRQTPDDLQVFLGWAETAHSLGEDDAIRQALEDLQSFPNASAQNLMQLAHLYDHQGYIDKAINLAYETLRQNMDEPNAHLGYIGLLLQGQAGKLDLSKEEVDKESAFLVEGKMQPRRWFVIEDENSPDFDRGEISADHPLASAVIGTKVGETVLVEDKPYGGHEVKVCEIKHKYLHALHQSMENFEHRFPDENVLFRVPVPMTPEGEPDLQYIKEMTAQRHESSLQILELYKKNSLPLCVVAKLAGVNSIEILPNLVARKDFQVKCCAGSFVEREQAFNILDNKSNGFVIDPITLNSIFLLGVHETVLAAVNKIGIVQSSIDLIDAVIEERQKFLPDGCLTIGYEDGQLTRQELTSDEVAAGIRRLEEMRKWAVDNCELLDALPKEDLSDKHLQISDVLPDAFYDTMLAASGEDRHLLSDDQHFRTLGKELFGLEGCWIQLVLMRAVNGGHLSLKKYVSIVTNLIRANFYFITINSDVLACIARNASWEIDQNFTDVASTLGQKGSELSSSVRVATEFLKQAWAAPIPWWSKRNYFLKILNILTENNWDKVDSILNAFALRRKVIPNTEGDLQVYLETIKSWCVGHFIKCPF
jgi:tetratricopeptide (TPR) repeat protein